jgi:hypothetical protein
MAHRVAPRVEADLDDIWFYVAKESGGMDVAIERRANTPFSGNRYYSKAKLQTESHLSLLSECATLLAQKS